MSQKLLRESTSRKEKSIRIVNGTKKVVVDKVYDNPCGEGYKRDPESGACVRSTLQERSKLSKSATKAANKTSTKVNKANSIRRRDAIIKESIMARPVTLLSRIQESRKASKQKIIKESSGKGWYNLDKEGSPSDGPFKTEAEAAKTKDIDEVTEYGETYDNGEFVKLTK